jgi:ubiquitin-like protein Pup
VPEHAALSAALPPAQPAPATRLLSDVTSNFDLTSRAVYVWRAEYPLRAERDAQRRHLMATRDEGGQKRATRQSEEVEEVEDLDTTDLQERHAELSDDVDDILDEIDSVLESNAEDFVRGHVQKGGQ